MKFLDAQKQNGKDEVKSILPSENKMQTGTRADQKMNPRDPSSLVSSSKGRTATTEHKTTNTSRTPSTEIVNLATELNVDLQSVKGSGPNGEITERDVRHAKTAR